MKFAKTALLFIGAASAVSVQSRMMLETSLVGLEAPNPIPSHNLVVTSTHTDADE